MAEEVQMSDYRDYANDDGDEERVHEWEIGLPTDDDLTPLSQHLIPPELASAFSISPEPCRSMLDVNRASQNTITSLRRQSFQDFPFNNLKSLPSYGEENQNSDPLVVEGDENDPGNYANDGSDHTRKIRRLESVEEADSALRTENSTDNNSARNLKRPRLVWTPQLHKRFVDVVAHLDIKNAVPKTIMQLMNVEGLTRENVASHLQKYRLYLKRMQGLSNEGPSSSDHLFASTPVAQSLQESGGHGHMPIPMMPYAAPQLMPMPVLGVSHTHGGHMGMPAGNPTVAAAGYHGFESHPYNMFMEQQKNWSGSPHVTSNDK